MPLPTNDKAPHSSRILWIRVASITPLLIMLFAYLASPALRGTLADGLDLLWNLDLRGIREWATDLGWWAPAITGMLMIIQGVAAPIPAVMVTAANSFLFGPFWGGLYSILTANVAAALCYGIGRGYGTLIVDSLISKTHLDRYGDFFANHGFLTVLIARLIPFVPFDPISYVAGIGRMPFWKFFWATMLGQFPAGMAYSYLVQQVDQPAMFVVSLVCVIAALLLLGLLVKRTRFRPRMDDTNPIRSSDNKGNSE